jgi:predicted transcriptional regulator
MQGANSNTGTSMYRNYSHSLEARDIVITLHEKRLMTLSSIGKAIGKSSRTIKNIYTGKRGVHKVTLARLRVLEELPRLNLNKPQKKVSSY